MDNLPPEDQKSIEDDINDLMCNWSRRRCLTYLRQLYLTLNVRIDEIPREIAKEYKRERELKGVL